MKYPNSFWAMTIAVMLAVACGGQQEKKITDDTVTAKDMAHLDSIWQRKFSDAQGIITLYDSIRQITAEERKGMHTLNQCHFVWHSGEYMFSCRGKNDDIYTLPEYTTTLSFENSVVSMFAKQKKIGRFADHYFTLQAMKNGCKFNDSRDGVTATVFYPIRALNDNDYNKLHTIFSCNNQELHNEYLERLKFPLNNSGCTDGLKSLQPLIEENVAESRLKQEVLEMYDLFSRIMPGNPAPLSILKDTEGKAHTFSEFKGKVLVIDVWATWCHSCLTNMHKFLEMQHHFRNEGDVCFITISIDRSEDRESWIQGIENNGMKSMLNLFPDCAEQSQFETDFLISGVPRYIIIGKDGNIVSAHAPTPGADMAAMIEKARFAEFHTGTGSNY